MKIPEKTNTAAVAGVNAPAGASQIVRDTMRRMGYADTYSSADPSAVRKRTDIEGMWSFLSERSKEVGGQKPATTESVVEKLVAARIGGEVLNLFSPWGPRYNTTDPEVNGSSPETVTIREIRGILDAFAAFGYAARLVVMPADSYGTDINNLSPSFVKEYFESLAAALMSGLGALEIVPWSAIREASIGRYDELYEGVSSGLGFIPTRALATARVFNPDSAEDSARRYIIERTIEAQIVDETYDPIKLSLVRKEKDDLDGGLKRIYVIRNKAPWLAAREGLMDVSRD